MATYKKTQALIQTDAAYIAGINDGEGTLSLSRKHQSDNRQFLISISNTDLSLLNYVINVVGAGKITNKKTYQEKHTRSYTYTITNRQALDLLIQINPYLKTYKRQRSELALKDYIRLNPINSKYSDQLMKERENFINEFFLIKP